MAETINILQLVKRYTGSYPLFNAMFPLESDQFRVHVCYLGGLSDGGNPLDDTTDSVTYLEQPASALRWFNRRLLQRIAGIIDRREIQIVNCQLRRVTPLGALAAPMSMQKPLVVSSIHGLGSSDTWRRNIQSLLLSSKIHRTVAVSNAVRQELLSTRWKTGADDVVTIANGLDLSPFIDLPDRQHLRRSLLGDWADKFVFGTAGRLSKVKNHLTMLKAFARISQQHPEARLAIAGRGDLQEDLDALCRSLNLGDRVRFLGFRSDVPSLLKSWDAFVFPSLREGMPLALIEAMAAGLPAATSRAGGIPEVLGEEHENLQVDSMDDAGLAAVMSYLLSFPEEDRAQLGEKLRQRAFDCFEQSVMKENYRSFYRQIYSEWAQSRGPRR